MQAAEQEARFNRELQEWEASDALAAERHTAAQLREREDQLKKEAKADLMRRYGVSVEVVPATVVRDRVDEHEAPPRRMTLLDPAEGQGKERAIKDNRSDSGGTDSVVQHGEEDGGGSRGRDVAPQPAFKAAEVDWASCGIPPASGRRSRASDAWHSVSLEQWCGVADSGGGCSKWIQVQADEAPLRTGPGRGAEPGQRAGGRLEAARAGRAVLGTLRQILGVAPAAAASIALKRHGLLQAWHAMHGVCTCTESTAWAAVVDASLPSELVGGWAAAGASARAARDARPRPSRGAGPGEARFHARTLSSQLDVLLQEALEAPRNRGARVGGSIQLAEGQVNDEGTPAFQLRAARTGRGAEARAGDAWSVDCLHCLQVHVQAPQALGLFCSAADIGRLAGITPVLLSVARCTRALDLASLALMKRGRSRGRGRVTTGVETRGDRRALMALQAARSGMQSIARWAGASCEAAWGRLLRRVVHVGSGLAAGGTSLSPALLRNLFAQYVAEVRAVCLQGGMAGGGWEGGPLGALGKGCMRLAQGLLAGEEQPAGSSHKLVDHAADAVAHSLGVLEEHLKQSAEALLVGADAARGGAGGLLLGASSDVGLVQCIARSERRQKPGGSIQPRLGVADAQTLAVSM